MELTVSTVRGKLVSRALTMPFAKRTALSQWTEDGFKRIALAEQCIEAAEQLRSAFSDESVEEEWSKADILADEGGPWWSEKREQFVELSDKKRQQVLDEVIPLVEAAASRLEQLTAARRWTFLWSEVQLVRSWDSRGKPDVTRTDLVGGNASEIAGIDLKNYQGVTKHDQETFMRKVLDEVRILRPNCKRHGALILNVSINPRIHQHGRPVTSLWERWVDDDA